MKEKKVRIGVLGWANIARRSIIPNLLQLSEKYQVVGVATRNLKSVGHPDLPELKIFDGYESLINSDQLEAVYIPLPNSMHYEWVKTSLEKNIHVLVEKSLACSHEEVIELNDLARDKNLVLLENFQFRQHSQLMYIQKIVTEKRLGELRYMRSSFCFPPFPDRDNIRYKKELGGGALLDAGAYPTKISQMILGNDLKVSSAILNYQDGLEVDIWGGACLKQNKGKRFSQIAFGFDNFYQCNIEIVGTKGKLYTNRIFTANEAVHPKIVLEIQGEQSQEIELERDNHFAGMLIYFHELICGYKNREQEYKDNINQARLLQEIKQKSNEQ